MHENGQNKTKYDGLGECQSAGLFANSIEQMTPVEQIIHLLQAPDKKQKVCLYRINKTCSRSRKVFAEQWPLVDLTAVSSSAYSECSSFPDDAAFPLFLGVVWVCGSSTTSQMRDSKDTKLLVRAGHISLVSRPLLRGFPLIMCNEVSNVSLKTLINTMTWTAWPFRLQPSQNTNEHHANSMAI